MAITGFGKQLSYCDTEGGTYVPVSNTVEINFPERELQAEEITNDDSPDRHKQYLPGIYEPGTTSFTYRYSASEYATIDEIFQLATDPETVSDATKFWKYTLPDGSVAAWQGFITKHDLSAEIEGVVDVEGEMQVNGPMTFTPAGSA